MPELENRLDLEADLATAIALLFAEFRNRSSRNGVIAWGLFKIRVHDILVHHLGEVHNRAFLAMAHKGLENARGLAGALGDAWVSPVSNQLADVMIDRMRKAQGGDPTRTDVFGANSVEVLVATEVTRAVSRGESDARRANAAAGLTTDESAAAAVNGNSPLDIKDGLIAIWRTERDDAVCPICRPLDKKRQEVWQVKFPEGPPAHPHCRCNLEYKPR